LHEGSPVVAIAEERLTGVKHGGGYRNSLAYCLKAGGSDREIDLVAVTSCCEPQRDARALEPEFGNRVVTVDHHRAHAYSAFWPSPFEEAIVVVVDCGGNTWGPVYRDEWWRTRRQQATYYVGQGSEIEAIDADFALPYDSGFGEVFRAFTHYLGWPSSTMAGNTMALAAYSESTFPSLFEPRSGRLTSPVPVRPFDPIGMAAECLRSVGVVAPPPRSGYDDPLRYADVAGLVQESLYDGLRWRIEDLVRRTGIRRACFAGGVALNCVAMGRLLDDGVLDGIFVQPASGDSGQSLGAAYAGFADIGGSRVPADEEFEPLLGRLYDSADLGFIAAEAGRAGLRVLRGPDVIGRAAGYLADGRLVAWFSGRSEFGPRALGARSILADPRSRCVAESLRRVKGREAFRPFAPAVLDSAFSRYFVGRGSRTMTVAVRSTELARDEIPSAVHVDGRARVQTVPGKGLPFDSLLFEFGRRTGVPALINTSLNLRGRPIVETPRDALTLFRESDLDVLYLDGWLITRGGLT
jgi:carbamoyltransferase